MIIVDTALEKRRAAGNPVRVAMVGAGYMARCIALQIVQATPGMQLAAIANRTPAKAEAAYRDAGVDAARRVDTVAALDAAIESGHAAVTEDPSLVWQSGRIEAVIEVTGDPEFGTRVAFESIRHGKHVILLNAEVDASVGPILKVYADRSGVVYTYTDGDEPGVAMNLLRFVASMGCRPVLAGQLKGFLDRYRNPDTQQEFATRNDVNAAIVASFADGSKLNLEATIMGNATGFVPGQRGMYGHACKHVKDLLTKFTPEELLANGLVDYALGAEPHTGAFVIAYNEQPLRRKLMSYLKMGDGPLHMFYTPYHLPPMQLPHSVARAVLFHDATITPAGAPVCDTITYAKRDLKRGERLDGMGGFTCYGLVDRYETCRAGDFLPMAVSLDCRVRRDIAKDSPLTYADVELPPNRLVDRLRSEMIEHFARPAVGGR
ncbi:MAG: Gfo/Idh/MocA family oxidoreductase [Burkholderiaceae bacterium]|nr:Gfo/Idh/MocA family oxidoreductase [Burkholderiaceae bacterium]